MNYSSQIPTYLTCTICVERVAVDTDSSACIVTQESPHPHRWLVNEHPDVDCRGALEQIDLNFFRTQSKQLEELTNSIREGAVRQKNLERTYLEERALLKELLAKTRVASVSAGIQSLLSTIDSESTNKIEALTRELAESAQVVESISAELDEIRPLAEELSKKYEEWFTWKHLESRVTIIDGDEARIIACHDCKTPLHFGSRDSRQVPSHYLPNASTWCRNSNVALSSSDHRLIAGNGDNPHPEETSFGGAPGEETGTSELWRNPKSAIKDVKTVSGDRKAKPKPNRDTVTPNDKAYWERNSVDL